jgi:hypothetical protein
MADLDIAKIIEALESRLRRIPREDEVTNFIFGTPYVRAQIWNQGRVPTDTDYDFNPPLYFKDEDNG